MFQRSDGRVRPRAPRTVFRSVLSLVVCIVAAGCADWDNYPRVNHYHNDSNQKLAEDAADNFDQFTAGSGSLTTLLDQDLKAREALEQTVSAARSQVLDTQLSVLATDVNWLRLRIHLLQDLGLLRDEGFDGTKPINFDNPPVSADDPRLTDGRMWQLIDVYNEELADRIDLRQARIQQAVNVLTLLSATQQALAKQAQLDVNNAKTILQKATDQGAKDNPATTQTSATSGDDVSRICLLSGILSQFNGLADSIRSNQEMRAKGTELQAKLLAAISDSRDSGSAVALVAILGTGLDDDSFQLLDLYIGRLNDQKQLDDLWVAAQETPAQKEGAKTTDEWTAVQDALKALVDNQSPAELAAKIQKVEQTLNLVQNSNRKGAAANPPGAAAPGATRKALASYVGDLDRYMRQLDAKHQLSARDPETKSLAQQRVALRNSTLLQTPKSNSNDLPSDPASLSIRQAKQMYRMFRASNQRDLNQLATRVDAVRKAAPSASKALRASADGQTDGFVKPLLKRGLPAKAATRASTQVAKDGSGLDPASQAGATFLSIIFSGDPTVAGALAKALGQEGKCSSSTSSASSTASAQKAAPTVQPSTQPIQALGTTLLTFAGKIQQDEIYEQDLATIRVDTFVSELFSAELDLHGENARHSNAMLAVAQLELKRWALLGKLNAEYVEAFQYNTTEEQGALVDQIEEERKKWGFAAQLNANARKDFIYDQKIRQAQFDVNALSTKVRNLQAQNDAETDGTKKTDLKAQISKTQDQLDDAEVSVIQLRSEWLAFLGQTANSSLELNKDELKDIVSQLNNALAKLALTRLRVATDDDNNPVRASEVTDADEAVKIAETQLAKVQADVTSAEESRLVVLRSAPISTNDEPKAPTTKATERNRAKRLFFEVRRDQARTKASTNPTEPADGNKDAKDAAPSIYRLKDEVRIWQAAVEILTVNRELLAAQENLHRALPRDKYDAMDSRSKILEQISDEADHYQTLLEERVIGMESSVDCVTKDDKDREVLKARLQGARLFRSDPNGASLPELDFISTAKDGDFYQAPVREESSIHASLRALGASARSARAAQVQTMKPAAGGKADLTIFESAGDNVTIANTRLFKAIRTVSGHILMLSLNQHLSEDNAIRLHTEIAEHSIQLDALEARVEEAGYRLTLGDLKAFHSSGINDADIATVQTAFETTLLSFISAKDTGQSNKVTNKVKVRVVQP